MISSETLFHFTSAAGNLISILEHEFEPRYCLESIPYDNKKDVEYGIPMTCFCDLPLSQIVEHISFYGDYGIGMSKKWGLIKGLNPILYINKGSDSFKSMQNVLIHALKSGNESIENKNAKNMIMLSKEYAGKMYRLGNYIDKKFYDEREWRYAPSDAKFIQRDTFMNSIAKADADSKIKSLKLSFEPDDIKYIIVKEDNEIISMCKSIMRIKEKYDIGTKLKLCSRVISTEQIRQDF